MSSFSFRLTHTDGRARRGTLTTPHGTIETPVFMKVMRGKPLDQIVNASVNQTLGRTVITSTTTFLAVLALYVFGGEVLRGFAFAMLVGVVTGTYSTVFIAATIAIILSRREMNVRRAQQADKVAEVASPSAARPRKPGRNVRAS